MRVPAELMQVFLPHVNLEIAVEASDHIEACRLLDTLRAILYSYGLTPTIAPFATSHSMNVYAGINSRSSDLLRDKLPEGLRAGITVTDAKVESWATELSLMCIRGDMSKLTSTLGSDVFLAAANAALIWQGLEDKHHSARTIRAALAKAPLMPDFPSSIMNMWQAMENLFGIDREVTYRNAFMLAELCAPIESRANTYNLAKKSYGDRSKIAHGSSSPVDTEQWMRAWGLLRNAALAILNRKGLPTASELTDQILNR